MTSRIIDLHELYGKYNEILPEEIAGNRARGNSVATELENHRTLLQEIIREDLRFIEDISMRNGLRSLTNELLSPETIIRWTFELDDEGLAKKKTELIKEGLAQWLVCKETLILLSQRLLTLDRTLLTPMVIIKENPGLLVINA